MTGTAGWSGRAAGRWKVCLLALLALAAWSPSPQAAEKKGARAEGQGNLPIEITADRLLADSGKETVTFEGNVRAVQGEVTLFSDRLFAEYGGAGRSVEKVTAEGSVRVIYAGKEARADRAVFFNQEQRIVLSGGAGLVQGEDSLKGDTVTIFLQENRSVVTGGEGGRVRAVIHPRGFLERKEQSDR